MLAWIENGKLRQGNFYDDMVQKRKLFKNALKYCRYNQQQLRDEKLASHVLKKNPSTFWKEAKNRTGKSVNDRINCIDGVREPKKIANLFAAKFMAITHNNENNSVFNPLTADRSNEGLVFINISELKNIISDMTISNGSDGIHTYHLRYANSEVLYLLSVFYNACLIHSFIPSAMLEGVISPRIKNKFGDKNDSDNYREVMISSNLMKCLEYIILPFIKENFALSDFQYGYREKSSTIMAIGTLKEAVRSYIQRKNVVYGCFMDMSRAFERVNHNLLLSKIRASNIPVFIANIIQSMLSGGSVCVNFNGHFSNT